MTKGERLAADAALCALFLRGNPIASCIARRTWPRVADALRAECPDISGVARALRTHGLYDAAAVCEDSYLMDWALDVCERDLALTCLHPAYPRGWLDALGSAAPPCLWVRGSLPAAPAVGIVGGRSLTAAGIKGAALAGQTLARAGRTLVTGGAVGADSLALEAALAAGADSRCVVVLPVGLHHVPPQPGVCQISVCEPEASFTTGQAMERNALIYAYGRRTVVIGPRLRQGGTWHGAVDALRRRLAHVLVHAPTGGAASRALVALGAEPFNDSTSLLALLDSPLPVAQCDLFGASAVRCPPVAPA